ncbi:MAG: hypothetical protein IKT46_00580 [Clostridia bacterium]|nr:hypothetical protein [Clostridia bacterium]
MIKEFLLRKLKDSDEISFCHNCGAVISDQPDCNDREDIVVCSKCGAENKQIIEMFE